MKVEPRDDAEVEERRQRLLVACDGFRAHDDHLKQFFNKPPPVNNFMQSTFGLKYCLCQTYFQDDVQQLLIIWYLGNIDFAAAFASHHPLLFPWGIDINRWDRSGD